MNLTSFGFSYRDPSRSCFTLDSGVTPYGKRANPYRYFVFKNIRAIRGRFHEDISGVDFSWIVELLAEIASPVRYRSCPHSSG